MKSDSSSDILAVAKLAKDLNRNKVLNILTREYNDCILTLNIMDVLMKKYDGYVAVINDKIVRIFFTMFAKADPLTRQKLALHRSTWNDLFQIDVLAQLDNAISKVDSDWKIDVST